jgi:catechol 2,3-dioxygenase-like lactoylglutathione lyase family enzyme
MRFNHMAFEVSDLEQSIAFYVDQLGFTEDWRHHNVPGSNQSSAAST